jgi:hypothetical protein
MGQRTDRIFWCKAGYSLETRVQSGRNSATDTSVYRSLAKVIVMPL